MTNEHYGKVKAALDGIIARVALVSPYYEMAREAQVALEQMRQREERLTKAVDAVLIGGNHLASALIGWLGADESTLPSYLTTEEEACKVITDVNKYDVWVCWKTIMLLRDIVRAALADTPEVPK